ncbi:MAG: hypothetical protein ACJ8E0_05295 [Sphingomicrobium sp.]
MLKLGAGPLAGALLAATLSLSPGSAAALPKKATRAPPPPAPAPPPVAAPPAHAPYQPAYTPPPQAYRQVTQPMAVHEPESMTKILSERQKQCRKQYNCLMTGPCQPCLGQ